MEITKITFINTAPPVFKEVKANSSTPWVRFSVDKPETPEQRHYPNYLVSLLNGSAKHNAIITGKVQYIVGGGLKAENGSANAFLGNINPLYSSEELLNRITTDIETFGGVRLKLIFDRIGRLKYVTHVPFTKVLTNNGRTKFYISDEWGTYKNLKESDVECVEAYNGINKDVKMLAWDIYRPQMSFEPKCYPLPDYVGAIPYIDMDREIANFHYNNLKNSFTGAHVLSLYNGKPSDEEKENIEKLIKKKFTGTDNAGGLMVVFNEPNAKGVDVVPLDSSNYGTMYADLNKQVQQEIFSGHKITSPELFGISTEGALGDRNATLEKYELFKKTYIANRQRAIESMFNSFLVLAGISDKVTIIPTEPLQMMFSEPTLLAIATKNELRSMIGLEALNEPIQMASHELKADVFAEYGKPKKDYEVVLERPFMFSNQTQMQQSEFELIGMAFKRWNLTDLEKKIVDVLRDNPSIAIPDLAKAVKKDVKDVENVVNRLKDSGLLLQTGGNINVTAPPSDTPPPANAISVMYEYALAPNVKGDAVLPTTRDFCRKLISLDRLYSRDDLNAISLREGRDVWATRGGWYNAKGSDVATPYCRHIWKQVIVVKK